MMHNVDVISAGETAALLSRELGTPRAWSDFLADNIRGKQNICGLTLMPCARRKDWRGIYRPVYAVRDILAFVDGVKKLGLAKPTKIEPMRISIDTKKDWRINCFNMDGKRMKRTRRTASFARWTGAFSVQQPARKNHESTSRSRKTLVV